MPINWNIGREIKPNLPRFRAYVVREPNRPNNIIAVLVAPGTGWTASEWEALKNRTMDAFRGMRKFAEHLDAARQKDPTTDANDVMNAMGRYWSWDELEAWDNGYVALMSFYAGSAIEVYRDIMVHDPHKDMK